MGKGDRKTKKGKRCMHSPRKNSSLGYKQSKSTDMENKVNHSQNAYDRFLNKFDSSDNDNKDINKINDEFIKVISELMQNDLEDIARKAELDRQVFHIRKSFEYQDDESKRTRKGLSWQLSWTQESEDGTQIPFYWPDVRSLTKSDFEFFEQRYNATNNLYAKTEYGLMVYFGEKTSFSKDNRFKIQLCNELLSLAHAYYKEAKEHDFHKLGYALTTLKLTFQISSGSKLEDLQKAAIEQTFDIQQSWDIQKIPNTEHIPLMYSRFMLNNYNIFKKHVNFTKVIDRNDLAINQLEKVNLYRAIDALILNDNIKQKVGLKQTDSLRHRAEIYEKIANNRKKDIASLHFIELALDIYQQIKDENKIKELEKAYSEKRNTFQLTEVSTQISEDYTKMIDDTVKLIIDSCAEEELLDEFATSPWYETDDSINTLSETVEKRLIDTLPLSIMDRHGNTIKTYTPEEGKFWSTYSFYFYIGTLKMTKLFIAAIRSEKLSYESALNYLEKTWLNTPIIRNSNNNKIIIIPLDTIKPGLKRLFEEFKHAEEGSEPDYVTVIDSLTLKIEGILRFFIDKLNIPTFARKRAKTKTGQVIMEKLFDDIIADLNGSPEKTTGFVKDHLTMLKFVMSEKIGWNLRNEVAHSLLQIDDYTLEKAVVLFCLITKLSKYTFQEQEAI